MDRRHFYTDEKNAQIVVALLNAHGIREVVADRWGTNVAVVDPMPGFHCNG